MDRAAQVFLLDNQRENLIYLFPSVLSHFYIKFKHQLLSIFLSLNTLKYLFLKTRSHDGSVHTFGSSYQFLEAPPKKGFKNYYLTFLTNGVKSDPLKFNLKNIKFGMVVKWPK